MNRLVVGITGAGGFLGRPLAHRLARAGHTVVPLPRALGALPALDALVHLAGESVAGLWTARKRRLILESRVEGTRRLVSRMRDLGRRPRVFLSASAAGFYGHRPGERLTEDSGPGWGFRPQVCLAWEAEARAAETLGIRTVLLRFATVLDPSGGFLGAMAPFLRRRMCFVLGRAGDPFPWISLEDAIGAIEFCIRTTAIRGPVNLAAPCVPTQADFARTLSAWLGRPVVGRLPRTLLRIALGEFATAMTDSQEVVPEKLLRHAFEFRHPELARRFAPAAGSRPASSPVSAQEVPL